MRAAHPLPTNSINSHGVKPRERRGIRVTVACCCSAMVFIWRRRRIVPRPLLRTVNRGRTSSWMRRDCSYVCGWFATPPGGTTKNPVGVGETYGVRREESDVFVVFYVCRTA